MEHLLIRNLGLKMQKILKNTLVCPHGQPTFTEACPLLGLAGNKEMKPLHSLAGGSDHATRFNSQFSCGQWVGSGHQALWALGGKHLQGPWWAGASRGDGNREWSQEGGWGQERVEKARQHRIGRSVERGCAAVKTAVHSVLPRAGHGPPGTSPLPMGPQMCRQITFQNTARSKSLGGN